MGWVSIDDGAPDHRKQLAAGPLACWLWVCGLAYCNRQKARDGFIPEGKVSVLYPIPSWRREASKLVEVGLWERTEGGYLVHDYHEYQLTAEKVAARQEARREAGKLGGKRSGESRRAKQASPGDKANAKQVLRENEAGCFDAGEANPNPSPSPSPPSEKKTNAGEPSDRPEAKPGTVLRGVSPEKLNPRARRVFDAVEASARHLFPSLAADLVAGAAFDMAGAVDGYPGVGVYPLEELLGDTVVYAEKHATEKRLADDEQRLVAFKQSWRLTLRYANDRARQERERGRGGRSRDRGGDDDGGDILIGGRPLGAR